MRFATLVLGTAFIVWGMGEEASRSVNDEDAMKSSIRLPSGSFCIPATQGTDDF